MREALEDSRLSMLGRTAQPYEASLLAELPRRRLGSNRLSLPWRAIDRLSDVIVPFWWRPDGHGSGADAPTSQ